MACLHYSLPGSSLFLHSLRGLTGKSLCDLQQAALPFSVKAEECSLLVWFKPIWLKKLSAQPYAPHFKTRIDRTFQHVFGVKPLSSPSDTQVKVRNVPG